MKSWFTVFINDQGRRVFLPPRKQFRLLGALWGLVIGLSEGMGELVILHGALIVLALLGIPFLAAAFFPVESVGQVTLLLWFLFFCWILPATDYAFIQFWLKFRYFQPVAVVFALDAEEADKVFDVGLEDLMRDQLHGVINISPSAVFLPILDNNNNYYNHVLSRLYRDISFFR